jgi:DNA-binding response OmpR family regulator
MWTRTVKRIKGKKETTHRILIIEDDPQIRSVICYILEREGYEVDEADDGQAGIRLYRENPADLIITDIILPNLPGSSVISRLWYEFPELKVIAISGGGVAYGPSEYLNFARELGARRILPKPFKRDELLAAVREVLE